jgi:ketosteroid isomerase-like protein
VKIRTLGAFFVLAFLPAVAVAAESPPPAAIVKLANAIVHTSNTDDPSGLATIFTADAVVVDEIAPFVWRGSSAGLTWWRAVEATIAKAKLTHFRATNVRIGEYHQTAADAYLIQAMTLVAGAGKKPFAESGTITYTFHNAGGKWLISTAVWTTKP